MGRPGSPGQRPLGGRPCIRSQAPGKSSSPLLQEAPGVPRGCVGSSLRCPFPACLLRPRLRASASSISRDLWPLLVRTRPQCFVAGAPGLWACYLCARGPRGVGVPVHVRVLSVSAAASSEPRPWAASCPGQALTGEGPEAGARRGKVPRSRWAFAARRGRLSAPSTARERAERPTPGGQPSGPQLPPCLLHPDRRGRWPWAVLLKT